jgi:hypothetical protein
MPAKHTYIKFSYEDVIKWIINILRLYKDFISVHWNHQQASPISWDYPFKKQGKERKVCNEPKITSVESSRFWPHAHYNKMWAVHSVQTIEIVEIIEFYMCLHGLLNNDRQRHFLVYKNVVWTARVIGTYSSFRSSFGILKKGGQHFPPYGNSQSVCNTK